MAKDTFSPQEEGGEVVAKPKAAKAPCSHAACFAPRPKILPDILHQIGQTPLVRVNKIAEEYGLKCELLAKCEYFNAGGSVKDRIAKRMFEEAEASGQIKPGDTIIEPTSGNTGLGLALCAAVKGYKCIICLPEKMSIEKVDTLKALGAQIIRTPNDVASDHPDSHLSVAMRLQREIPNSHILDQYKNPFNPKAHYDTTAEELLEQCDGQIDMVVAGAGTGGTLTGISRKLKEYCPNVKIVGVDPVGSIMAEPAELNVEAPMWQVEGIGYDFIPESMDRSTVDMWYKSSDKPSFLMARKMVLKEGIMCGGSSGTAMSAAVEVAKELGPGQRCVVILPDGIRNYMSKFMSDDWMSAKGYLDDDSDAAAKPQPDLLKGGTVADLKLQPAVTVKAEATCKEAVSTMQSSGFDYLPVVDKANKAVGMACEGTLLSHLAHGKVSASDPVSKVIKPFDTVNKMPLVKLTTSLADLETFLETNSVGLVADNGVVAHVVAKMDLLTHLLAKTL